MSLIIWYLHAMLTEELNFELPAELIAQIPAAERSESRLLVLDRSTGKLTDTLFSKIGEYLRAGDCLVLNDTKVLPARFFAHRQSGAKLEGLWLGETEAGIWRVMLKNSRKIKPGESIILTDRQGKDYREIKAVEKNKEGIWSLDIGENWVSEQVLGEIGFAPLPPYIKRGNGTEDYQTDIKRYQTVYAKQSGAVAAPTAGLHFTEELLGNLEAKGVEMAHVTLHVGAGTFKPVTAERIEDHDIHSEEISITEEAAAKINSTLDKGGRIVAVGTTSVRTLESLAIDGRVVPGSKATKLFIQPGYQYKIVDAMITNFHLPKSTLLALVGAFAGMETMMGAYKHAIEQKYRFFSYGDAMLIV